MPVKRIALVWFKTNLRLRDNESLFKAVTENDEVVPFYYLDDLLLHTTNLGFKKAGDFRLVFLKESLLQLNADLRKVGSGLLILKGKPEDAISRLVKETGAQTIYAEKEVAPEELNTEKKVEAALLKLNCAFLKFECRNLFHSSDLPFPIQQLPELFTDFRKKTEKIVPVRPLFPAPPFIKSPAVKELNFTLPDELSSVDRKADPRAAIQFKGGAEAAHNRLQYYFYQTRALSSYKQTRNGMVGEGYSSKFSAWLALGCISAKEIYQEIKAYEGLYGANDSTYWLFFELLWRDYFGFCMQKNGRRYFLKSANQVTKADNPAYFNSTLNKWISGQTGEPFVDANMTELKLTGYMSNRGRQNVASYLCNDLNLDWRYGAAYFEQQLVDYDVCNNWANWAYLAGVGNDPKVNRYFNIAKQAATYDNDGRFRKLWVDNN